MAKLKSAERRTFKLSKLREPEYNPNQMTEAEMERLEASMEKFGVVEPPVVNTRHGRTGVIVGGSHRVRVLRKSGNKEADCTVVDLELADEKELNLRLNKHRGSPVAEILKEFFEPDELLTVGFTDLDLASFDMIAEEAAEELLGAATPGELPAEVAIAKLQEIQDALGAKSVEEAVEAAKAPAQAVEDLQKIQDALGAETVEEAVEIASTLAPASTTAADPEPPDEFPVVDENIPTDHQCPKCSYRWSGSTSPTDEEDAEPDSGSGDTAVDDED